jgi:hypothetical protein
MANCKAIMMKRLIFRVCDEVVVDKASSSVPYFCKRCQNEAASVKIKFREEEKMRMIELDRRHMLEGLAALIGLSALSGEALAAAAKSLLFWMLPPRLCWSRFATR